MNFCISSVRKNILSQYVGFLHRLGSSVSSEARLMSRIAGSDIRSMTGTNCHNLEEEFGLDPWSAPAVAFKQKYKYYEVSDVDKWRLPLLETLLKERYDMKVCGEETLDITGLIDSLCSS